MHGGGVIQESNGYDTGFHERGVHNTMVGGGGRMHRGVLGVKQAGVGLLGDSVVVVGWRRKI
jgi:hypothetical protein